MIGTIDKNLKNETPILWLCKPSKERIFPLFEVKDDISLSLKYNDIHQLTVKIPSKITKDGQLVDNYHIEQIKGRYLLEFDKEYFIIENFGYEGTREESYLTIESYHLPFELRDKSLRDYKTLIDNPITGFAEVGPKNLTTVITETLTAKTPWRIDYVDATFDMEYRAFEFTGTVLEFVLEVANAFRAVIYWNSKDRLISFYQQENLGNDRGFYISDERYLKRIMESLKFESVCTRLYLYGKDNISIQESNPLGQTFIENYSYFMYPYQESTDGNRTILSSSEWMSDALCYALTTYQLAIEAQEGVLQGYLVNLKNKNEEILSKENQIILAQGELQVLLKTLDYLNDSGASTTEINEQITLKDAKQLEITNYASQLSTLYSEKEAIATNITNLQDSLAIENYLTPQEVEEKIYFEIHRTLENASITDPDKLYEIGVKELEKLSAPPVNIDIEIVNFLRDVRSQRDWDKIAIGDLVTLSYPEFGISINAKMHEINIDYKANSINLLIADFKRLSSDEDFLRETIFKNSKTSTELKINKSIWDLARDTDSIVKKLLEEGWDANKTAITAGNDNEVIFNERGLLITDPGDPLNFLVGRNSILAITNDGGNTYKNAITKDGIVAERLIGQIIAGQDLTISNTSGTFTVNADGVTLDGQALIITGGITESSLDPAFTNGLLRGDLTYANGIRIDTTHGMVVTRSDNKVKTTVNATAGFKIEADKGTGFESVISLDESGNLNLTGNINLTDGYINWDNVNKFAVPEGYDDASAVAAVEATYIDANGVWTPYVYANNIDVRNGKIRANQIEVSELYVGTGGITLDNRAVLTWSNLSPETQTNLTGAQGPTGPQGPAGPAGTDATVPEWVTNSSTGLRAFYELLQGRSWDGSTIIGAQGILTSNMIAQNITGETITGATFQTAGAGRRIRISHLDSDINFYTPGDTLAATIDYDVNGAGTSEEAANRLFLKSHGQFALKMETTDANLSIHSKGAGKKIYLASDGEEVYVLGSNMRFSSSYGIIFGDGTVLKSSTGISAPRNGTSTFLGNGSTRTISHGLGKTPLVFGANPLSSPGGYLGEMWVNADATNIYIGNSGAYQGSFSWFVM